MMTSGELVWTSARRAELVDSGSVGLEASTARSRNGDTGRGRSEFAFTRPFLSARLVWLGLGLVTQLRERRAMLRPRAADLVWVLASAETVWSTARTYGPAPARDRGVARADLAVGAVLHACACSAVGSGERFWLATDWIYTLSLMNAGEAGSALSVREGVAWLVPIAGLYSLAVWPRQDESRVSTIATNVLSYGLWFGVVHAGMAWLRRTESELAVFEERATEDAAVLAATQEREVIEQELHTQAREALLEIAELITDDHSAARAVARRAALTLRSALMPSRAVPGRGVGDLFARLSKEGARVGYGVEAIDDVRREVPAAELTAAGSALRRVLAALDQDEHAARIVIRAASDPGGWRVTVRVRPPGGVSDAARIETELASLLDPVGGTADVVSAPGYGARIDLLFVR